jgi:hypothetical protein
MWMDDSFSARPENRRNMVRSTGLRAEDIDLDMRPIIARVLKDAR